VRGDGQRRFGALATILAIMAFLVSCHQGLFPVLRLPDALRMFGPGAFAVLFSSLVLWSDVY